MVFANQTERFLLLNESYSGAAGASGLLTGATVGLSGGTGAYSASYDNDGRLTNEQYTYTPTGLSAQTLYQVQPTYDALGNVIETVTTLPQGVDTQVFCYDDLSRLVWAGSSGTPTCSGAPTPSDTGSLVGTGAQYSASYGYDSMNRLTVSSGQGAYTYGDSAHADAATSTLIGGWSASYDAAGDLTCEATRLTTCAGSAPTGAQLSYDNEGQLASWQNTPSSPTSTDSFLYDGEGNRVEQVATVSGTATTTTYVGSLEDVTTTGGTTTTAYYAGLALSVNGALSYTLSDGLGSVAVDVSASTGGVTGTQLYDPYGNARYSSGTMLGSYGYTGQQSDSVTGLDYYGARYYAPGIGQFTSGDTTYAGGANLFGYVGGNPESFTDPSGHAVIPGEEAAPEEQEATQTPGGAGGGIDPAPILNGFQWLFGFSWCTGACPIIVVGIAALTGQTAAQIALSAYFISQLTGSTTTASTTSGPTTIGASYTAEYGGISGRWPSWPSWPQVPTAVHNVIPINNGNPGTPPTSPEPPTAPTTTPNPPAPPGPATGGAGATHGVGGNDCGNDPNAYVIGENMDERVIPAAMARNQNWWKPWPDARAKNDIMTRDKNWLRAKIRDGVPIRDIGPDLSRAPSDYYKAEREVIEEEAAKGPINYCWDPQPAS